MSTTKMEYQEWKYTFRELFEKGLSQHFLNNILIKKHISNERNVTYVRNPFIEIFKSGPETEKGLCG